MNQNEIDNADYEPTQSFNAWLDAGMDERENDRQDRENEQYALYVNDLNN